MGDDSVRIWLHRGSSIAELSSNDIAHTHQQSKRLQKFYNFANRYASFFFHQLLSTFDYGTSTRRVFVGPDFQPQGNARGPEPKGRGNRETDVPYFGLKRGGVARAIWSGNWLANRSNTRFPTAWDAGAFCKRLRYDPGNAWRRFMLVGLLELDLDMQALYTPED